MVGAGMGCPITTQIESVPEDWGGYWTEVKLEILRKYLGAFNRASQRAGATVYLDLFAGSAMHVRPDTEASYAGSTTLALATSPPFTRLLFWELGGPAKALRRDLSSAFPGDRRYTVLAGDCNEYLQQGLSLIRNLRRVPTFAFIDPKGLDVSWETLQQLSQWRQDPKGRKVELWILLPEPALARVLGLQGVRGRSSAALLTNLYGCDDWVAIHQRRQAGTLNPERTRAEFVNLFRWRLENILGYGKTHALQLGNVNDQPVYTMIFATDAAVGDSIMRDVYDHASVHEIPLLRTQALSTRRSRRERERGVQRLFEPDEPTLPAGRYQYTEPWAPPERLDAAVELDDEPEEEPSE
jgi:three-Cys-motif partner protein